MSLLLALLIAVALAEPSAEEAALLAPRLDDLTARLAAAEGHLAAAAAYGRALGRVHNTMAAAGHLRCSDELAPTLAWRAEVLGQAWRDALQSARADLARLERMRAAPTIAPLLDDALREQVNAVSADLSAEVVAWQSAAGWQSRHVLPWYTRCPWTAPAPRPGLPSAMPEAEGLVAIITVGEGTVCPGATPAGGAAALPSAAVCVVPAGAPCDCAPRAVLPAAVVQGSTQ